MLLAKGSWALPFTHKTKIVRGLSCGPQERPTLSEDGDLACPGRFRYASRLQDPGQISPRKRAQIG